MKRSEMKLALALAVACPLVVFSCGGSGNDGGQGGQAGSSHGGATSGGAASGGAETGGGGVAGTEPSSAGQSGEAGSPPSSSGDGGAGGDMGGSRVGTAGDGGLGGAGGIGAGGTCGAGTCGFAPSSLANLFVWLEANVGVELSNANVTQWNDQSGNAYNAFQPTSSQQPALAAGALNGLPVVTFAGSQTLRWPSSPSMTSMSVFAVYQLPIALEYTKTYDPLNFGGPTNTAGLYTGISIGSHASGSANGLDIYGGFGDDEQAVLTGIAASGPSTPYQLIDWVSANNSHATKAFANGTGAAMTPAGSAVNWTVQLGTGSSADIGAIGFCPNCGGGEIATPVNYAEIVVYNAPLADPDRQRVEGYLAWKWGLQSSLPTGHPYRNARP